MNFSPGFAQGHGRVHGEHGSYAKLTADVFSIVNSLIEEKPWTLAISPLAVLVPLFTAGHWLNEMRFCEKWSAILEGRRNAHEIFVGCGTARERLVRTDLSFGPSA